MSESSRRAGPARLASSLRRRRPPRPALAGEGEGRGEGAVRLCLQVHAQVVKRVGAQAGSQGQRGSPETGRTKAALSLLRSPCLGRCLGREAGRGEEGVSPPPRREGEEGGRRLYEMGRQVSSLLLPVYPRSRKLVSGGLFTWAAQGSSVVASVKGLSR